MKTFWMFGSVVIFLVMGLLVSCQVTSSPKATAVKAPPVLLVGDGEELNPYLELVVALSRDDFAGAKPQVARLVFSLVAKQTPEALDLSKKAAALESAQDLHELRSGLRRLSKSVGAYARRKNLGKLNTYYCPHKNGYWLSTAQVVENPYAGAEMFSCGSRVDGVK